MRVECEACRRVAEASLAIDGDTVRATCPTCQHVTAVTVAQAGDPVAPIEPSEPRASDATVPDAVRDAWLRATEHWSDLARHDELLRLVALHASYAWAAGRYRTRGRDPVAQQQLARLSRAAMATLLASATARPDAAAAPYRALRGVLVVLIVVVVVGAVYALAIRERALPRTTAGGNPVQPLTPGQPMSPSTSRATVK